MYFPIFTLNFLYFSLRPLPFILALDKARTSLDLTLCPPTRHWHAHWYDPAEPPPGWAVPDLSASPHRTDTLLSPLPCSGLIIGYPYVSSAGEPLTGPSSPDVSGWCWVYGKDHPLITTVQCVKHHQIHGSVQWGHLLQQNSCVLTHILVPARAEKWAASPSAAPVSRTPSQPSPSTAPPLPCTSAKTRAVLANPIGGWGGLRVRWVH